MTRPSVWRRALLQQPCSDGYIRPAPSRGWIEAHCESDAHGNELLCRLLKAQHTQDAISAARHLEGPVAPWRLKNRETHLRETSGREARRTQDAACAVVPAHHLEGPVARCRRNFTVHELAPDDLLDAMHLRSGSSFIFGLGCASSHIFKTRVAFGMSLCRGDTAASIVHTRVSSWPASLQSAEEPYA